MAWEVYRRTLEWEEVQRVPLNETMTERKPAAPNNAEDEPDMTSFKQSNIRNRIVPRKCTKLAHLLTLRSQGTKVGCSTVCGECAQEISWEILNRDGRPAK